MVLPSLLPALYFFSPIIYPILSWPPNVLYFPQVYFVTLYVSVTLKLLLCALCLVMCLSYILCLFSPQPRSILDPKLLGLQSGGWVVAHMLIWSVRNCTNLSSCAVLHPLCWGTCSRYVTNTLIIDMKPQLEYCAPCFVPHITERRLIYKVPDDSI